MSGPDEYTEPGAVIEKLRADLDFSERARAISEAQRKALRGALARAWRRAEEAEAVLMPVVHHWALECALSAVEASSLREKTLVASLLRKALTGRNGLCTRRKVTGPKKTDAGRKAAKR